MNYVAINIFINIALHLDWYAYDTFQIKSDIKLVKNNHHNADLVCEAIRLNSVTRNSFR
ncbi:unnamed protein product [Tenebrio molitor]|nr:unnamed protein product [Tenebrio molitor]